MVPCIKLEMLIQEKKNYTGKTAMILSRSGHQNYLGLCSVSTQGGKKKDYIYLGPIPRDFEMYNCFRKTTAIKETPC